MQALGIALNTRQFADFDSWADATRFKAVFLKAVLQEMETSLIYDSVVWIDADARVRSRPDLLFDLDPRRFDIAAHRFSERELLSGTLWFANNATAREIVDGWIDLNDSTEAHVLEQANLKSSIDRVADVRFHLLPPEYAFIFDLSRGRYPDVVPVIEHFQRSRVTRRKEKGHA
jgi:hypothetical protein